MATFVLVFVSVAELQGETISQFPVSIHYTLLSIHSYNLSRLALSLQSKDLRSNYI